MSAYRYASRAIIRSERRPGSPPGAGTPAGAAPLTTRLPDLVSEVANALGWPIESAREWVDDIARKRKPSNLTNYVRTAVADRLGKAGDPPALPRGRAARKPPPPAKGSCANCGENVQLDVLA